MQIVAMLRKDEARKVLRKNESTSWTTKRAGNEMFGNSKPSCDDVIYKSLCINIPNSSLRTRKSRTQVNHVV